MAESIPPPHERTLAVDNVGSTDDAVTLACRGQITLETAGAFKAAVKRHASDHQNILADLGAVDYVDSSGLGEILAAYTSAKSVGCQLILVKVPPRLKDLLDMTRLASVLDMDR
jgi:anti-sigma B factor antagonist